MGIAVLLAWLALFAMLVLSLPMLPAQIGDPGHELPRLAYIGMLLAVATLLPAIDRLLMPWLARNVPQLVNMPNRDYWLADSRREATLTRMRGSMAWMELLMLALLAGIHAQVLLQFRSIELAPALWTGLFVVWNAALVFWIVRFQRSFSRKD